MVDPEFPPCEALHIIDYLMDAGPMVSGGALPHSEIRAWMLNAGVQLCPWELQTIRRLSLVYADTHYQASDPAMPPPYQAEETSKDAREEVARQVKNSMKAYFMARGEN